MKKLILLALLASTSSFADQISNWTCEGSYVKISAQTPYLGEDSPAEQTLYTITQMVGGEYSTSQQTAYFLTSKVKRPNVTTQVITGNNAKGGAFTLTIKNIKDVSDDMTIKYVGTGSLTFKHGYMQGSKEKVDCVRE